MKTNTINKGGRPRGSVLPAEDRKKRINISISDHHKKAAVIAGDGNVSAGIGIALDVWAAKNLKKILK